VAAQALGGRRLYLAAQRAQEGLQLVELQLGQVQRL
jgi:hypothetical protein